ncbi:MAG: GreA/GreB family elongation factor [Chloroflexi bacterium]|nr:GreA/GreB family elongation factor [Chloroflexota bacterium]
MSNDLIVSKNPADSPGLCVAVGTHVIIKVKAGASERLEFDLVPDRRSDFSAGLMSDRAPLAQAILGRSSGETVQYLPPSGAEQTVTILSVEPSKRELSATSDRADVLGETMDKIARRESRQIALTTELHYGSIDPDGIEE